MSLAARNKHRFQLIFSDQLNQDANAGGELYWEDRRTLIPDRVAFLIDYPCWLQTLSTTKQRVAKKLAAGDSAAEVARSLGMSAGRISQIRRELAGVPGGSSMVTASLKREQQRKSPRSLQWSPSLSKS